jgi:hypothetical protein
MYSEEEAGRLEALLNSTGSANGRVFRFLPHWHAQALVDDELPGLRIVLASTENDSTIVVEVPVTPRKKRRWAGAYDDRVDYIASLLQETFHSPPPAGTHVVHRLEM